MNGFVDNQYKPGQCRAPKGGHTLLVVVWRQLTVPVRREISESFRSPGQVLPPLWREREWG